MSDVAKASNAIVQVVGFYADALSALKVSHDTKDSLLEQLKRQLVVQARTLQVQARLVQAVGAYLAKVGEGGDDPLFRELVAAHRGVLHPAEDGGDA